MTEPGPGGTPTGFLVDAPGSSRGFDEETRAFLQKRLRILTGVLAAVTGVLLAAFLATALLGGDGIVAAVAEIVLGFPNSILTVIVVVSGTLHVLLRRRRLPPTALAVADGLFVQALIAPCLVLFATLHHFSFSGFAVVVPFLSLFILTRAVLVPSTAPRTVLLSLPAPLGVLAIQLWAGGSFAFPDQPYPPGHFVDMVIQNQVLLGASVAVAAVASRVNLGLRRSSYDARRLGQYDIEGRIGAGAMGEVYLARHALLKRPTAIKLLRPSIAGSGVLERFEREVQQTSRLSHPNTVSIFDYGHTAEGVFYYAMEFLIGADLAQIVDIDGPVPPARVIHVLEHACAALAEAHSKGIIHRDLKAANIMLCEQGGEPDVVKILDFGLAKVVDGSASARGGAARIVGTPETMAPEAVHEYAVSARSDLYSLAVVGCFLLTGRPIFDAETVSEFIHHHRASPPIPPSRRDPSVPRDLEAVLLRGLAKDPGHRPQSAHQMRSMLLACEDAGGWSVDDARAWWTEFEEVRPVLRPEDQLGPGSLHIPLGRSYGSGDHSLPGRSLERPRISVAGDGTGGGALVSDSAATRHGDEVSDSAATRHGDEVSDSATTRHGEEVSDSATTRHGEEVSDSATTRHGEEVSDSATTRHGEEPESAGPRRTG